MVRLLLSTLLSLANCLPVQDTAGSSPSHTDSPVNVLRPTEFGDKYIVLLPDDHSLLQTDTSGDQLTNSVYFSPRYIGIEHKPGSKHVYAYSNTSFFMLDADAEDGTFGSLSRPLSYLMASQAKQLCDLSVTETGPYLFVLANTTGENAFIRWSSSPPRLESMQFDGQLKSCAANTHSEMLGLWCVTEDRDLYYYSGAHRDGEQARLIFKDNAIYVGRSSDYIVALTEDGLLVLNSKTVLSSPMDAPNDGGATDWVKPVVPQHVGKITSMKDVSDEVGFALENGISLTEEPMWVVEYTAVDGTPRTGLWLASQDGSRFKETIQLSSTGSVWRVLNVLYARDSSEQLQYSRVNGHYWSKATADVDFTREFVTSHRLSAAFKNDGGMISLTSDGINWTDVELPTANSKTDFQLMLADRGDLLIVMNFKKFWAWFGEWVEIDGIDEVLQAAEDGLRETFIIGTKLFINGCENVVDLASFLELEPCGLDVTAPVEFQECVLGQRRTVIQRPMDARCLLGDDVLYLTAYDDCACVNEDYTCLGDLDAKDRCPPELLRKIPGDACSSNELSIMSPAKDTLSASEGASEGAQQGTPEGIKVVKTHFRDQLKNYLYLPGTSAYPEDETVVVWTSAGDIFVSQDQGSSWNEPDYVKNVISVFKSDTNDNQVYAFSSESLNDNKVYVSWDRAHTFELLQLPAKPSLMYSIAPNVVTFHPQHPDWMLFTGAVNCDATFDCPNTAFVSKDKGATWNQVYDNVLQCTWVHGLATPTHEDFIYCFALGDKADGTLRVIWSTDYFASGENDLIGINQVYDVVTDNKFVISGFLSETGDVEAAVSRDGVNFERMKYPPNLSGKPDDGLVLIRTDDNSVTLYEGASGKGEERFGSIIRSGGYGTNFVSVLDNVNRASGVFDSYVDIDQMLSVEGVLVANVVENADDVLRAGASKRLVTYISHSNGAKWSRVPGPDAMCGDAKDCFLNLHGHSERLDARNTPSSPTAVGMFFGRGNVGASLGDLSNSQTYLTRDAGITWKKVSDRPMFWEYGDSGSILILVDSMEPTNTVWYSLDEGDSWQHFVISETFIKVTNIATIPSDTSRKFIIFGQPPVASGQASVAIQIDFKDMVSEKCKESDYSWWTPAHPQLGAQCLLGHKTSYRRRKPASKCLVGKTWSDQGNLPTTIEKKVFDCECTRNDYECDYGYVLDLETNVCKLIDGFSKPTKESQCTEDVIAWHEVTGYRKLAASTCKGGEQLDAPQLYACPGKEQEFKKQFPDGTIPKEPPTGENPPNGPAVPGPPSGGSTGSALGKFVGGIIKGLFVISILVVFVVQIYLLNKRFESRGLSLVSGIRGLFGETSPSIRIPETSNATASEGVSQALHLVKNAAQAIIPGVQYLVSKLPFIGSKQPYDHLGFYSRMDDEERMRILESDDGFEDDTDDEDGTNFDVDTRESENIHGVYNDEEDEEEAEEHNPFAAASDDATNINK